jgi:peroxiredoxin
MKHLFQRLLIILLCVLTQQSNAQLHIGDIAPDIKLPDSLGKWKPLSEVKGKLILIDFWAVWCYPCMKSMPDVVALYDKYKDKGLVVYAVSIDKDYYNWVDGCRRKKLPFVLVNDAYGFNGKACKDYQVSAIPHKVLVKNGIVIGSEMSLYDLEKLIVTEIEKQ